MIYFFADDHYQVHPGKMIYENLPPELKKTVVFTENDWSLLESGDWTNCELLILNMIAGTCNQPMPGGNAENAVKRYCERGGNILLLHGSSAAFWHWEWWRKIVGLRWVRGGDPDQAEPSMHPHSECTIVPAKSRHPLVKKLIPFDLENDEVYIHLEQTAPIHVLMNCTIAEGTFPQCVETISPWGGKLLSFIPGHLPANTANPDLIKNICYIIEYLKGK